MLAYTSHFNLRLRGILHVEENIKSEWISRIMGSR